MLTILLIVLILINIVALLINKIIIKENFKQPDFPVSKTVVHEDNKIGSFVIGELQFVFGNYVINSRPPSPKEGSPFFNIDFRKAAQFPFLKIYSIAATPLDEYEQNRPNIYFTNMSENEVTLVGSDSNFPLAKGSFLVIGRCDPTKAPIKK